MLLQDFKKLFRIFSCKLSLKKPFIKYYDKHAKSFDLKFYREIENVKKYFRDLTKIFTEGYKETFQKGFLYHCRNDLANFSKCFEHDHDVVKKHSKKCYCEVLQSFPEFFVANYLKKPFVKYYEQHAKRFLANIFLFN